MPHSSRLSRLTSRLRPRAPVSRGAAPSVPARYLTGLVYPATTASLIASLVRNEAPDSLVDRARKLEVRTFASGEDIVAAIRGR
jgi:hypothetical protein